MKILFIHPPVESVLVANNPKFVDKARGKNTPLGINYISSYIGNRTNHTADIYDGQVEPLEVLINKLVKNRYDVIGISVVTFTLVNVVELLKVIKTLSMHSVIIAGGTHPTIYPQETLDLGFDIVVQGEGEEIFHEILDDIVAKEYKPIYKLNKPIDKLDNLPFPDRRNIDQYFSIFSKGLATTIISSRGCPFSCGFCFRPALGKAVRFRTPDNLIAEIKSCIAMGIDDFMFYDDTFTIDKKRALEICQRIIDEKLKIRFDIRTRVNTVDEELLRALKSAGMVQIRLGIESGVQKVLDAIKKGITLQDTLRTFELCKKLHIETCGYVMFGCPTETREDIHETIKFVIKLNPDFVHATVFTPFPATEIYYEWVKKHGKDVWLEFAKNPTAGFVPPVWGDIPREELEVLVKLFYKKFYLRPSHIMKIAIKAGSLEKLKKYVNAGLCLFSRERWR